MPSTPTWPDGPGPWWDGSEHVLILDARGEPPPSEALAAAVAELAAGRVVAIPTDTVYGLAVDPFRPGGIQLLFAAKGRPRRIALPVLVADEEQAESLVGALSRSARALADRWWPGALTLVLARPADLSADLGGDGTTVGLRCPAHPVPVALCRAVGPLATTSANRHGQPPAITAPALALALGDSVSLILDGGPCAGAASTVVDCTGSDIVCLRQGAIPWEAILAAFPT